MDHVCYDPLFDDLKLDSLWLEDGRNDDELTKIGLLPQPHPLDLDFSSCFKNAHEEHVVLLPPLPEPELLSSSDEEDTRESDSDKSEEKDVYPVSNFCETTCFAKDIDFAFRKSMRSEIQDVDIIVRKRPYALKKRMTGFAYGGCLFDKFEIEHPPHLALIPSLSKRDKIVQETEQKLHIFDLSPETMLQMAKTKVEEEHGDIDFDTVCEPLETYIRLVLKHEKNEKELFPNVQLWPPSLSHDQSTELFYAFYWVAISTPPKPKYKEVLQYYFDVGWDIRIKEKYEKHGRTVLRHPHLNSQPRTSLGPTYLRAAVERLAELEKRKREGRPVRASCFQSRGKYGVVDKSFLTSGSNTWNDLLDTSPSSSSYSSKKKRRCSVSSGTNLKLGRPRTKFVSASSVLS